MQNNVLDKKTYNWVIAISAIYIIINGIFLSLENFYFLILPVVFLMGFLYFFYLDKLLLLITFLTPLSLTLEDKSFNIGVALPTEPLMFGVLLLFFLKYIYEGYPKQILKHPITIAILINLSWMLITCLTSSEIIISLKYFVSRLWFLTSFFFLGVILFKDYKNLKTFIWAYLIPLSGVIIYTLIRHTSYGMDQKSSNWIMNPFYKDHTSYGAVIAMYFPLIIAFIMDKENKNKIKNYFTFFILFIFTLGLLFSYTRAAWLSLFGSLFLFLTIYFKVKLRNIIILSIIGLISFITFQDEIIMSLKSNKKESSKDIATHVESISNISSDASNLERINRWSCALRMFKERPIFGWGPGTYQFKYAPFQLSSEKTIISTDSGDMGNAHSEYIGPLAESGLLGTLSFLGIIGTIIYTAIRAFQRNKNYQCKLLALSLLLGIFTYFLHGFLNNFLDIDKASVPFWGFAAAIVAIDIYHNKEEDKKEKESN